MTSTPTSVTDILRHSPLIDGHNDLPWAARQQVRYDFDQLDIATDTSDRTHTDIARLREGCVGGQFWSVYVPATLQGDAAVSATLEQVDAVHQMVGRYPDAFGIARTADEVEAVFGTGRIASLMGAEGGHSIGCSLATLRMMYVLGVRYMTLTHNDNVPWADSATDEPVHQGLSRFGVEVVREMNRTGMLVDLSHVSADTMRDALKASEAPVIFSHSSARAVCDSPRNAPDDVLESLRDNNGVIMATFVPDFVSQACADWRQTVKDAATAAGLRPTDLSQYIPFAREYAAKNPRPKSTLAETVAHFEHIREVCGIDHLGVGGDYDGTDEFPEGLGDVSSYPKVFAALQDKGWSDDDLRKVAGGNVLRVMRDTEAKARELQGTRGPSLATYDELDGDPQAE